MGKVKVKLNSPGMKSLLNDEAVRDIITEHAEDVLATAWASAPVDSGDYRDGLEIIQNSTDRVAVHVAATAPHGMIVEARLGVLSRALGGDSTSDYATKLLNYTTKDGRKRKATQAQIDNWTRGRRK